MDWYIKNYQSLSKDELFEILRLRVEVFVVEQNCPYQDIDETDRAQETQHVFLTSSDELVAYARCYRKNDKAAAIGRVIVSSNARGQGIAHQLMERAIETCFMQIPAEHLDISAQCYLADFYTRLGFEKQGEAYLEDGIPHQDMRFKGSR
ncbi:GNAT family N-acetyltransferase [Pseudoalteromonas sp. T1lg65]|uniref:GNAT family N-acetyltransferase n=1 Tax=Pseudoalteromonas sp. T1lg65 TaxID=2077101 RepID=UPI003F797AC0